MFDPNALYRLFVGLRIDNILESVFVVSSKQKTTTEEGDATTLGQDQTNLEGITYTSSTAVIESEKELKKQKIIIVILCAMIATLILISCCYCLWTVFHCKCVRETSDLVDAFRLQKQGCIAEKDSLDTDFVPKSKPLPLIDEKHVNWFNPKRNFNDVVMPFFIFLLGNFSKRDITTHLVLEKMLQEW